ncbi:MAG: conserved hypothetical protein partial [Methanobrevibacter sp. CfCl-M3]
MTGEVTGPLVKDSKADVLKNLINENNILLEECAILVMRTNDISMLEASGSISFNQNHRSKNSQYWLLQR